jgi:hypothetical protein
VFEMGTGVSPPLSSPGNLITYVVVLFESFKTAHKVVYLRSSPRSISTSLLNASLHLHFWPIYHLVLMGSYLLYGFFYAPIQYGPGGRRGCYYFMTKAFEKSFPERMIQKICQGMRNPNSSHFTFLSLLSCCYSLTRISPTRRVKRILS